MCLSRSKRWEKKELDGWKVFLVMKDGVLRSLYGYGETSYEPGMIYSAVECRHTWKHLKLKYHCDMGFHAFRNRWFAVNLVVSLIEQGCHSPSELVVKRVRLYDVKWKGNFESNFPLNVYRECVTAERMEILE